MRQGAEFFWSHHNRLNESIRSCILTEEQHRVQIFNDAIPDITQQTVQYIQSDGRPGELYTGYAFYPGDGHDAKCEKVDDPQAGVSVKQKHFYPIYLKFIDIDLDLPLVVEHKDYEPERIVIVVNILFFKYNSKPERWITRKLKHELTHARTLYSKVDIALHKARKYQTNDIDYVFKTDNERLNTQIYKFVGDVLYVFSPTEMDARLNETVQKVHDMSISELGVPPSVSLSVSGFISKLIVDPEDENGIQYMHKIVNAADDPYGDTMMLGYAVVGLHLKRTRRHKDPLLTEAFVKKCFDEVRHMDVQTSNKLLGIVYAVGDSLEKILWDFEKRMYDAIFTELCERGIL